MSHMNNLCDASDESYMIHIHTNTNESYASDESHTYTQTYTYTPPPPPTRTHPHTPTHLGQQSGAHVLPRGGAGAHAESRCRVCRS